LLLNIFKFSIKSTIYYNYNNKKKQNNEKKGTYFGELALLDDDVRKASVIATTDCECFELDRSTFKKILGSLQQTINFETQQRLQILKDFSSSNSEIDNSVSITKKQKSSNNNKNNSSSSSSKKNGNNNKNDAHDDGKHLNIKMSDLQTIGF
jgi:hypothetical protein